MSFHLERQHVAASLELHGLESMDYAKAKVENQNIAMHGCDLNHCLAMLGFTCWVSFLDGF